MTQIPYDGAGEVHVTDLQTACEMNKDSFDRVVTVCQDDIGDNVSDTVAYEYYCMSDGPTNAYGGDHSYEMFHTAATSVHDALTRDETVLVHCHMGQSRSVSVVAAALGRLLDLRRADAIERVRRYRATTAYPDQLLMQHVSRYLATYSDGHPTDDPTLDLDPNELEVDQ